MLRSDVVSTFFYPSSLYLHQEFSTVWFFRFRKSTSRIITQPRSPCLLNRSLLCLLVRVSFFCDQCICQFFQLACIQHNLISGEKDRQWKVCVRNFQLMPHPHSDRGGEEYFSLGPSQVFIIIMQCNIAQLLIWISNNQVLSCLMCNYLCYFQLGGPLQNIIALRFILSQTSPVWKEFYIDDIKLFKNLSQVWR
jgi:hypothetical protein